MSYTYTYGNEFKNFPSERESLEQLGVVIESVSTIDDVLFIVVDSVIDKSFTNFSIVE